MRQVFDSRARVAIPNLWPSRVTIQSVTYTLSASNQKVPSGVTDEDGLINLECRIGPIIAIRPTDDEIRDSDVLERYIRRHLKINAYCPQIVPRDMQAVVDGVIFPIRGVEFDSQKFTTRLKLEVVKP